MLKAIKIWWLQHLKDVEEWKKQDKIGRAHV